MNEAIIVLAVLSVLVLMYTGRESKRDIDNHRLVRALRHRR